MEKYIHIEYSSGDLGGGNLICDGVNDSDMIDEAIGLLSRNGGGSICFDGGIYNLSRPIIILDDNIHIVGNKVLKTIFRPTDDWRQYETIDGAYVNGVVNFVGVDNYGVSNITTDPLWNNVICNGINSIPSGKNGAGDVCTNGTIENNEILLSNGHAYGIWNQRSKDTLISNNVVNGFSSDGMSPHQEGVEVYGGYNVNICNNSIINIGANAINIGGLPDITPDVNCLNIRVEFNSIYNSRVGLNLSSAYDPVGNNSANVEGVYVGNNSFENISEFGIRLNNLFGSDTFYASITDVEVFNNSIIMAIEENGSAILPMAMSVWNDSSFDGVARIYLDSNSINYKTLLETQAPYWISPGGKNVVEIFGASTLYFKNNVIDESFIPIDNIFPLAVQYSSNVKVFENNFESVDDCFVSLYNVNDSVVEKNNINIASDALQLGPAYVFSLSSNISSSNNSIYSYSNISGDSIFSSYYLLGSEDVMVTSGDSDSFIFGNNGSNVLDGGRGNDAINGGMGIDVASYEDASAGVQVKLWMQGYSQYTGSDGWDVLTNIENLLGSSYDDFLVGDDGSNALDGGLGNDRLIGGLGDDVFVVFCAPDVPNLKYIADFVSGEDQIVLKKSDESLFNSIPEGSLDSTNFFTSDITSFSGQGFVHDLNSNSLFYVSDLGVAPQELLVLGSSSSLVFNDIIIG